MSLVMAFSCRPSARLWPQTPIDERGRFSIRRDQLHDLVGELERNRRVSLADAARNSSRLFLNDSKPAF